MTWSLLTLAFLLLPSLRADDVVQAGRFVVEPATLICLGFEWEITGDDNRNSSVEVSYRKSGTAAWKADGGVHNIRVMRNRGFNAAQTGLSAQPVFGGPAYFIRNILYNTPVAFKFNSKPAGLLVYHNTVIAENRNTQTFSNGRHRNNLFLGTDARGRGISIFPNATAYSTWDYDGFRPNQGVDNQYVWIAPEGGKLRDYEISARNGKNFKTLADMAQATGQETHGIELDYDIFQNVRPPDPTKPNAVYNPADYDFRLKPGSKAVDTGVRLPNVNDDFTGQAPDLGALEAGNPLPVYGPRVPIKQPFFQ